MAVAAAGQMWVLHGAPLSCGVSRAEGGILQESAEPQL